MAKYHESSVDIKLSSGSYCECLGYDTKQPDGEAPVMLEL